MHLKAYAVDGIWLGAGSGNFSRSGLAAQNNELVPSDDPAVVSAFERNFDAIFARSSNPHGVGQRERGGPR
jgi:hypothetical protein